MYVLKIYSILRFSGDLFKTYIEMTKTFRSRINHFFFDSDSRSGRIFDIILLILILVSVLVVILESVPTIHNNFGNQLRIIEWCFTIAFTLEYVLRIYSSNKVSRYIFSFYGIIDLLAILPAYTSLLFVGTQSLLIIRACRLLRVFRILKVNRYLQAGQMLIEALKMSRHKIGVFLFAVITVVLLLGTVIYLIEGEENGFTSIPISIYWAIVTLTTVGYGDITPHTMAGQFVSGLLMIIGYAIIAVPTGIISVEMARGQKRFTLCKNCGNDDNDRNARFCKSCGHQLS